MLIYLALRTIHNRLSFLPFFLFTTEAGELHEVPALQSRPSVRLLFADFLQGFGTFGEDQFPGIALPGMLHMVDVVVVSEEAALGLGTGLEAQSYTI